MLGALIRDQAPNPFFLLGRERAATALRTSPTAHPDALRAILLVTANCHARRRVASTPDRGLSDAAPEGANYLPPELLLRLGTQLASVFCFHVLLGVEE